MTYLTIPAQQLPFLSPALQQVFRHFDCYRNPWNNTREYEIPSGVMPVLLSRHPEFEGHRRRYPVDIEQPSLRARMLRIDLHTGAMQL